MKKYVSVLVKFACIFLFTSNINAQVVQQQADKWQLTNGVKLESETSKKNLIKLKATKVSPSINSQNIDDVPQKKKKNLKPPKESKYGNKKSSKIIKREDDE